MIAQLSLGQAMNKDILFHTPGLGTYLILSCAATLAAILILCLNA
jgi:hypothetical protein